MNEWHDKYERDDDDLGEEWKGKKKEDDGSAELAKMWLRFLIKHRENLEKLRDCIARMKNCNHEDADKPKVDEPPVPTNADHTRMLSSRRIELGSNEHFTAYMEVYDADTVESR